jgi:Radical SAM superfamily
MSNFQEKRNLYQQVLENPDSPEVKRLILPTEQKIQMGRVDRQNWLDSLNLSSYQIKIAEKNNALELLQQQGFRIPNFAGDDESVIWNDKIYHLQNALSSSKSSDAGWLIDYFRDEIIPIQESVLDYAPTVGFGATFGVFVGDPKHCNNMFMAGVGGSVVEQDPYGTQSSDSVISITIEGRKYYLGSRHDGYDTTLVRLTDFCNKGCAYCYFGKETRNKQPNIISDTNEGLGSLNPVDQVRILGNIYRENPKMRTRDVLYSGGEPMDLDTRTWEGILREVSTWDWLDSFRICTGAFFLGSPQSISTDIIDLIFEYQEHSGVRVCFNCNVTHPEQMLRLETIVKYHEMRDKIKGLTIYPQIPVTHNNFDIYDLEKSYQNMLEICKITSNVYDGQVYKFICDMQGSIPKLLFILVASRFDSHQGISNIVKPVACEIFSDSGNSSNLSVNYNTIANIKQNGGLKITLIDSQNEKVEFAITHANGSTQRFVDIIPKSINVSRLFNSF